MSNQIVTKSEGGRPDVDDLLRHFFQSELPKPWPALRLPQPSRVRQVRSFWSGSPGRLALAASIALLVAGYLTLSGFFPSQQADNGLTPLQKIGMKERGTAKKTAPTATEENSDEHPMVLPMNVGSPRKKS